MTDPNRGDGTPGYAAGNDADIWVPEGATPLSAPSVPSAPSAPSVPTGPGPAATAAFGPAGSPSAYTSAVPSQFGGSGLRVGGSRQETNTNRYAQRARTAVPEMVVALVVLVVTWRVVVWAFTTVDVGNDDGPSYFLASLHADVAFLSDGVGSYGRDLDWGRMWWMIGAVWACLVAVVVWIRRVGANARVGHGEFGAVLVLLALPNWFTAPMATGDSGVADIDEAKVRLVFCLMILTAQALGARWLFTHRLWEAGRLPGPLAHFALWVPVFVSQFFIVGSATVVVVTENPDAWWQPTETMDTVAQWTYRGTMAAWLVVAIVVTITQHIGIAADRREMVAAKGT